MSTDLTTALQQLQAPTHVLALANSTKDFSFLRYLYLRYLHVPDDGQLISNDILLGWTATLGVTTTATSTSTATTTASSHFFTSKQILQLADTVACIISHDNAHKDSQPDPSSTLITALSANPNVFSKECQLFPFDLQWIVNAANAAPQQFTASIDALQVELEQSQAKCAELQAQDDVTFKPATLDETLKRSEKASSKMYEVSAETSKMLQEFSQLYHSKLEPLTHIRAPRLGHMGRLSRDLAPKLGRITTLMMELTKTRQNVRILQTLAIEKKERSVARFQSP
jgi:hypothetical protein